MVRPKDNFTILRLNAEKFGVRGTQERLMYNFTDLLVSVGGFLGLFIGLSINDVMSFIIDIVDGVMNCVGRKSH